MSDSLWFDFLPLWALVAATVLLVLAAIEAGYRLALYRTKALGESGGAPVGSVIGGTLGLLAFILAFSFEMAAQRFEARRQLLLDEVNAIGTCYLRAGLLPERERLEIRRLLREYVHLRAEALRQPAQLPEVLARSDQLHDALWSQAEPVVRRHGSSETYAIFIESLNEVIDLHTKRVVVANYRIPSVVWSALYLVAVLSMAGVGYQFGRAGGRDLAVSLLLALSFTVVLGLIADLDRTTEGYLRVSQRPMIELDQKLQTAKP